MAAIDPPNPAVVVGLDLNGLGVVRSLGAARIPVVALDTAVDKPTCATRYARVERVASLAGEPLIDRLLALREGFRDSPVLLLTQEGSVATVSALRARLSGAYRFSMPDHALMQTLMDKGKFQALAEEKGAPIPRAVRLRRGDDASALRELRFPCVLKPATKEPAYTRQFAKAYRVASPQDALDLWEQMRAVIAEAIAQEWIEGEDSDVYFCLQYRPAKQGPAMSFAGRKLRQWPALVGGTASCIPAPEAEDELEALTDRFFDQVGFVGLGSMEYKRDRRDGRFYMVEPTVGRTDHQEELASLNGANIPYAAYLGEMGLPLPPSSGRSARGWYDPEGLERNPGRTKDAAALPMRNAYWCPSDPLPFLAWRFRRLRAHFESPRASSEAADAI